MKERPILFSGSMVKATLDGRKTQTRRVLTVPWHKGTRCAPYEPYYIEEDGKLLVDCSEMPDSFGSADYREASKCLACPYGQPGDRLWVRETWQQYRGRAPAGRPVGQSRWNSSCDIVWRADGELTWSDVNLKLLADPPPEHPIPWRPSIHMPRWASRITLEVTGVRVERVQEISELDAAAEGVEPQTANEGGDVEWFSDAYARLWDQINAKRGYSWASNPWVWVVEFRRVP